MLTFALKSALAPTRVPVQVNKHGFNEPLDNVGSVQARREAAAGLTVEDMLPVIEPAVTVSVGLSALYRVTGTVATPLVNVTDGVVEMLPLYDGILLLGELTGPEKVSVLVPL